MMWTIAALYRFVTLEDIPALKEDIQAACDENGLCGTILLAPEGINGTIAGEKDNLMTVMDYLDSIAGLYKGEVKYSHSTEKPFNRMKVRPKKEIITMRTDKADPTDRVGTYVTPDEWNDVITDPDVVLIDTRNTYETKTGLFKQAVDPQIENFTEFKDYVEKNLDPQDNRKVAMYCTGGIRCEKASSYMLAKGFETVYHLKGGILKYLETVPTETSLWEGECFVFDKRVTVKHGLEEGSYQLCFGCREPLAPDELDNPHYEEGVSCPHCYDDLTPERAAALRMRHRQMNPEENQ